LSNKENPSVLDLAKEEFADQRIIAIIGSPKTGKTVVSSLLLEAIVNKFLPQHEGYGFRIKDGIEHMKKNSLSLRKGKFPAKTAESDINKVKMVLTQNKASGGEISLRLHDFAGEIHDRLLSKAKGQTGQPG